MSEIKNKQFITEEVKPMVRTTIPDLIKRVEALEGGSKPMTDPPVKVDPAPKKPAPKKPAKK